MLKSTVMGTVTLALLTKDAKAVKYRPPAGATPWYKVATVGENADPMYPYNYTVPNFGVDTEIEASTRHLALAESEVGQEMKASFRKPKGHPVDYKVPNFGQDHDITVALNNIDQSETNLKHKWVPPTKAALKAAEYERDYFVPNFGQDHTIKTSLSNTESAESLLKHKWIPPTKAALKAAEYERDYFVPNFGLDKDILQTQEHIAEQETKQGHKWAPEQDENGVWVVPSANKAAKIPTLVQTEADIKTVSDPTCSSAGCNYRKNRGKTAYPMDYFVPNFGQDREINRSDNSLEWAEGKVGHKWNIDWAAWRAKKPELNYFVPNFGVDEDIKMTQGHVAESEKALGHKWTPVEDENGVWVVPTANKDAKVASLLQTDAEVKTESDPNCSSAGCNYRRDRGKTPYPMDYFVPNFGRDQDINQTWSSLDWSEGTNEHKFNPLSKKEAKKLEVDGDYRVPDFGLDEDVVQTQEHIKEQEKVQKHEWKPIKDDNGVYIVPTANKDAKVAQTSSLVQTESQLNLEKKHKKHHSHNNEQSSDPICSSAGHPCDQNTRKSPHPIDYKVPNFGVDQDIIQTQKHIAEEEKK